MFASFCCFRLCVLTAACLCLRSSLIIASDCAFDLLYPETSKEKEPLWYRVP